MNTISNIITMCIAVCTWFGADFKQWRQMIQKLNRWKDQLEKRHESWYQQDKIKTGTKSFSVVTVTRWPRSVCGRVESNPIQRTKCLKCIHRKCSGVMGSIQKASSSDVCGSCPSSDGNCEIEQLWCQYRSGR